MTSDIEPEAPPARPRRPRKEAPEEQPEAAAGVPPHPPLTQHGLHDEALKDWFITHYPQLAAFLYTGRIIPQS